MHVQMFGLPGAGKTFITNQLCENNDFVPIKLNGNLKKISYSLLFFFVHPFFYLRLLKALFLENKNRKLFLHKLKLFLRVTALESKKLFFKKTIIDDGLCQFLITIFERKINKKDLLKIEKLVPKNAIIFIIETSDKKRLMRMNERGRIPRSFLGEEYLEKISPVWKFNAKFLKHFFLNNFDTKIIDN
jgi:hypothetical protein